MDFVALGTYYYVLFVAKPPRGAHPEIVASDWRLWAAPIDDATSGVWRNYNGHLTMGMHKCDAVLWLLSIGTSFGLRIIVRRVSVVAYTAQLLQALH